MEQWIIGAINNLFKETWAISEGAKDHCIGAIGSCFAEADLAATEQFIIGAIHNLFKESWG